VVAVSLRYAHPESLRDPVKEYVQSQQPSDTSPMKPRQRNNTLDYLQRQAAKATGNRSAAAAAMTAANLAHHDDSSLADSNFGQDATIPTHSATVSVPKINANMVMDQRGMFVDADDRSKIDSEVMKRRRVRRSTAGKSNLSESTESFKLEDSIMDRMKRVSYQEISSSEKREVS